MNGLGWLIVVCAWLIVGAAHLQTTQGTYEDHIQVAQAHQSRPRLVTARGLTKWTIWAQVQRGPVPWQMRLVTFALSGVLAGLVGLLANQIGLTGWIAAGLIALHPLMIETVATLSGRAELIAAIGVVGACLIVTTGSMTWWRWLLCAFCLGLGWLGKETAIVGLVLVPMTLRLCHPRSRGFIGVMWLGLLTLMAIAWSVRGMGLLTETPIQSAFQWALLQSGATVRLISLSLWPRGLTVDYDYDALSRLWLLAAGASLAVLWWMAGQLWTGYRRRAFSLTWVLVACLPRLIVQTPKSYLNEHQFTLALVGVALGLTALAQTCMAHGYGFRRHPLVNAI